MREIDNLPNEIIGNGRGAKRKVIVRSSYFQHRVSDEEEKKGKNKKFALEEHRKGISSSVYRDLVIGIESEKENMKTGLSINNSYPHQVHTLNQVCHFFQNHFYFQKQKVPLWFFTLLRILLHHLNISKWVYVDHVGGGSSSESHACN